MLASVLSHCFRIPRQAAEGGLRYAPREEPKYTAGQLEDIETAVLSECRRGADTLHYEDVRVGEEIPETVRGPLNRLDMTCYYAGAVGTSGYKSTRLKWLYAHLARTDPSKLPDNYDPSYYAAAISPSIGHQDLAVAQSEIGMPGPYDNGPQRIGMMTTPVNNWMGNDGRWKALSVRTQVAGYIRRHQHIWRQGRRQTLGRWRRRHHRSGTEGPQSARPDHRDRKGKRLLADQDTINTTARA